MKTFWVIEKGGLYVGLVCNQYGFFTIQDSLRFHDEYSARRTLEALLTMFSGITEDFHRARITEHESVYD